MTLTEKISWLLKIVMVASALNLLAIKIIIVLEIDINSSSSTDRGEGTRLQNSFRNLRIKVTFHIKIS